MVTTKPITMSIQEVSRKLNLAKHTLRFWEKEFEGILVPLRSKGGQRRYTGEHLNVIEEIRRLKEEGLRLSEIKKDLKTRFNPEEADANFQKIDHLANRIAEMVKSALYRFLEEEKAPNKFRL